MHAWLTLSISSVSWLNGELAMLTREAHPTVVTSKCGQSPKAGAVKSASSPASLNTSTLPKSSPASAKVSPCIIIQQALNNNIINVHYFYLYYAS